MTGRALTLAELDERRLELVDIKTQLRALGRRKSVVETEILTGRAAPVKGAPAEQLPLVETTPATTAPEAPAQAPEAAKPATATTTARTALQMREAVLAALRAAKGRRSGKVLATLLGESEQDVHECLMELIQRGEAHSARRGGYEATDKPQPQGRDIKPGKGRKKGKKEPATPPPAEIVVLGDMTMAEVRQVLLDKIGTWKRWHSGAAADLALWDKLRESGHAGEDKDTFDLSRQVDEIGHEALAALATEGKIQSDGDPGRWGNCYAPLGVPRTAEGGPDEPLPPRAKKTSKKPASKAPAKKTKTAAKGKKASSLKAETHAASVKDIEARIVELLKKRKERSTGEIAQDLYVSSVDPHFMEALSNLLTSGTAVRTEGHGEYFWRLAEVEAPAPPPAAPQASRQELLRKAIMDELGHGLATFGELLTTCMRDLAWTSQEMPKTTEVRDVLKALCEEGKVVWDEAKKVYHLPPPPPPAPKKKGKAEPQTAGAFLENLLASVTSTQWGQARGEICERIAQHKGRPVSVGPLLLKVNCDSNLVGAVVTLLEEAGALSITYRGKVPSTLTLSVAVSDEEIDHDLQALTRRYVRDLVEDWGGDRGPTTADLAGNLDQPPALVDSVLIELRAAQELLCDREGRWSVRSPKASAAARTAPLFDDVEPAPAIDGLEPEGDGS